MVVLDVDTQSDYDAGHVPGAQLLDRTTELSATRDNGVSNTVSQVATQTQMNDLIQRTGIDEDTVVVFTGGGSHMMHIGRAYFNFRYWGFPKKRLRVLNGTNATYEAAGYTLETVAPPAPTPSTYSVCDLPQNTSVRTSLEEMIAVAEDSDETTVVIDARSAGEYAGDPGSTRVSTDYVAFEGHIKTAVHQEWSTLMVSGGNGELLPKADLETAMSAIGVDSGDTTYSYCRTSWRAAATFLALDAVLGWPTQIYDGAWIEWGQMADEAKFGALTADSPWRTDVPERSDPITYNDDNGVAVEQLTGAISNAASASAIEQYDETVCAGGGDGPPAPGY
jgi:3-mercaptopyruvate sulfurtransferase SseA